MAAKVPPFIFELLRSYAHLRGIRTSDVIRSALYKFLSNDPVIRDCIRPNDLESTIDCMKRRIEAERVIRTGLRVEG